MLINSLFWDELSEIPTGKGRTSLLLIMFKQVFVGSNSAHLRKVESKLDNKPS